MDQEKKNVKKRQRSENWLEEDKLLLMDLVKERVHIIENKNTDTNTNNKKLLAWSNLLESFNSMCSGGQRTLQQLKAQWGILKMVKKKKIAMERKLIIQTGGGPPPQIDPVDANDICSWLPNEFITERNEFDSDDINQVKGEQQNKTEIDLTTEKIDFSKIILPGCSVTVTNDAATDIGTVTMDSAVQENFEEITSVKQPSVGHRTPKSVKKKINENKSANQVAQMIAATEIECRKALHEIQMENERKKMENEIKKSRNLDLKEILMKKKIEYFEKNMNSLDK